jgi:Protein of unknown function (DUF3298)
MAYRLASMYLFGLLLLAGCSGKSNVQQDITLASSGAPSQVQTAPTRSTARLSQTGAEQDSALVVVTGSGATTNIVSDPTFSSGRSALVTTQGADASPIAIPSPVQSPTRLATAVMLEPASATAPNSTSAKGSSPSAAEASGPSDSVNASAAANAEKKIASKILTFKKTKPDCKGSECPVLNFKRLSFTGYDRFNSFLEQTLLSLALVETNRDEAMRDLTELELYFFKAAKPRDEIALASSVKYMSEDVVVVQLDSYIYTGGAHGISTTQYLNWLPKTDKLLTLEAMLVPGREAAFQEALKQQHVLWLKKNSLAKDDPTGYNKLWPFEPSDNVALLENGLAVTYDPYVLAPYSFGKPTIYIPYRELKGILLPELLPKS